ncbi:MAG: hypothetical protein DI555_01240 [Novosphingobium pentaromativorans]|uniref:Phasin domain-containing protein n=1 Tax=Novosphingobium pentaromativorans TaxID=205844 RepID=A0A2W5NVF4_9SPHN|nr:MAG: hypothetical protein DI555_01240 [Novosphingobium pentaromativorans]
MIEFAGLEQGMDRARSMGEQLASTARIASERMVENGQEIQAQVASQISAAGNRLLTCLDSLAKAGDPAAASQAGASFVAESLRAYGENMATWSDLLLRACRVDFAPGTPNSVAAE